MEIVVARADGRSQLCQELGSDVGRTGEALHPPRNASKLGVWDYQDLFRPQTGPGIWMLCTIAELLLLMMPHVYSVRDRSSQLRGSSVRLRRSC